MYALLLKVTKWYFNVIVKRWQHSGKFKFQIEKEIHFSLYSSPNLSQKQWEQKTQSKVLLAINVFYGIFTNKPWSHPYETYGTSFLFITLTNKDILKLHRIYNVEQFFKKNEKRTNKKNGKRTKQNWKLSPKHNRKVSAIPKLFKDPKPRILWKIQFSE